jgi:hypothetical protein
VRCRPPYDRQASRPATVQSTDRGLSETTAGFAQGAVLQTAGERALTCTSVKASSGLDMHWT